MSEAVAEQSNRLEVLTKKYGVQREPEARQAAHEAFDASSRYDEAKAVLRRVSSAPRVGEATETGNLHAEMAAIQLDLAALAESYGKLNVEFSTVLGKDRLYTAGDVFGIAFNSVLGRKQKVREIRLEAARRKGNSIEYLIERMGEVLGEQYQRAVQGKERAKQWQVENIGSMKRLDRKIIESLRKGFSTTADYSAAEIELARLEAEVKDIDGVLESYEKDLQGARAQGNADLASKLADEMSQVLEIKHGVLEGRYAAEGVVSEVRRNMLDKAEAVQSAKGALGASKVNYQAINALIDAMTDLEIKYRHAQEDMIPVFTMQGRIAALGTEALKIYRTLIEMAGISQRLMDTNAKLVTHLAAETFNLLQTPIYDPAKAREVEGRIRGTMDQLNKLKVEWATYQQTVRDAATTPHYAKPA